MVEKILADFNAAYALKCIILRYFNAAGADPDGDVGEEHDPEPHLIPIVLEAAAGLRSEVTIFGGDHATPDGTCIRDYVHVSDLAGGHVLALQKLDSLGYGAFNLGTGEGASVSQVIAAARRVTGKSIPSRVVARRPGDPARLVASAAKARIDLSWTSQFPDLEPIIRTAWRWHEHRKAAR